MSSLDLPTKSVLSQSFPQRKSSGNPFATRHTTAQSRGYLSKADSEVQRGNLFERLDRHACVAVVGPHGTGKTTLLKWWWRNSDQAVGWMVLSSGQVVEPRGLPSEATSLDSVFGNRLVRGRAWWANLRGGLGLCHDSIGTRDSVWIIDGWEQLPTSVGWLLRWILKRRGVGLVVTSHQDVIGFTTIHRTRVDDEIVRMLVDGLLDQGMHDVDASRCVREHVEQRLADRSVVDVREFLFELYDVYAQGVSQHSQS